MKLLKFSAAWCQPCKVLSKTLETVDIHGCELREIDISEDSDLAAKYRIRNVPTLVLVDDNDEDVAILLGAKPKRDIEEWLKNYV